MARGGGGRPHLKIQKLPNSDFMYIQEFEDPDADLHHFLMPVFEISKFQHFQISNVKLKKTCKRIQRIQKFNISTFQKVMYTDLPFFRI